MNHINESPLISNESLNILTAIVGKHLYNILSPDIVFEIGEDFYETLYSPSLQLEEGFIVITNNIIRDYEKRCYANFIIKTQKSPEKVGFRKGFYDEDLKYTFPAIVMTTDKNMDICITSSKSGPEGISVTCNKELIKRLANQYTPIHVSE
ncbi:hypothetical protein [Alteribacter natronophilus]|uniref:hypothetical protein n=1 Tax=Alteribacter natronophilus TaxID=2583810 RepID=UPI00110D4DA1|nr:hypothetical protein [Alteribacter natronophilus]TMW71171.1 hypothetical protein FGB90_14510 [Alteribacter natronophilus]